ncbi:MAG: GDSL-type esterase/lipase family protein [Vicinamibacteria bacterium]
MPKKRRVPPPASGPDAPPPPAPATPLWRLRLLSIAAGLTLLVVFDLGLRVFGILPPRDPMQGYAESFERGFSPLVEDGPDHWTIRPDWVNAGESLAAANASEPGRLFLVPSFRPARFAKHKAPGTRRIVALGDSTMFGLFAGADGAFVQLVARLAERNSAVPVEAINLACPGWASDRVANLAPTALGLEPDLVIVYVGHNELLGRLAAPAAPLRDLSARLLPVSSLYAWAWHWRARRQIDSAQARGEDAAALAAGQVPVFDPLLLPKEQQVLPTPREADEATARYRASLQRIAARAREARVPLLFVVPAANLLMPPAVSVHPAGFASAAEFDALQQEAQRAFERGDGPAALAPLERAIALSPRFAMAHYWRGTILAAGGRKDEARRAFQHAVDDDARTYRISSPLLATLTDVAQETGTPLADLRPLMHAQLDFPSAHRLFVDFCHPTKFGHAVIAQRLLPDVLRLLHPSAQQPSVASPGT